MASPGMVRVIRKLSALASAQAPHFYFSELPKIKIELHQIETVAPQKIETKLMQNEIEPPQIEAELLLIDNELMQIETHSD